MNKMTDFRIHIVLSSLFGKLSVLFDLKEKQIQHLDISIKFHITCILFFGTKVVLSAISISIYIRCCFSELAERLILCILCF